MTGQPSLGASRDHLKTLYAAHLDEVGRRVTTALERSGFHRLVIHSGSLKSRTDFDDQFWPLRVIPHFAHWLPLEWPDCALSFEPGHRPCLLVFRDLSFWERPGEPDWDHFSAGFEITEVKDWKSIGAELGPVRSKAGGKTAWVGEDRRRAHAWGFADEQCNPAALVAELDATRILKTDYEVECLALANRRSARGHRKVAALFAEEPRSELDLHLRYLRATRQDDAETPYKNIVATGPNAAILHHVHYGREPREPGSASSLLLDAGAVVLGYASDVTRTHVVGSGAAADAFRLLLDRMEGMQQTLCKAIQVGQPYEALHDHTHQLMAEILLDSGFFRRGQVSAAELVEGGATRKLLPHGLGHSLGLQTHDVGCLKTPPRGENPWLRNTTLIAEGQVFTIEPGLYLIDTLLAELRALPQAAAADWTLIEALRPYGGIRIEDDVWVGAAGHTRNLTREALGD